MSGGASNPIANPTLWQVVTIAGIQSPGYCVVKGFKRAHEWDVKKGKGVKGANITFTQRPPAKGQIQFFLGYYDASGNGAESHFLAWDFFLPLFKYDPTKKSPQAVDIYHPSLADIDITSVVTENIGALEHMGDGLYSSTVDLLEYFPPPPKNATGSPSGSKSTGAKTGDPPGSPPQDVPDSYQKQIDDLLKQAQAP